MNEWLKKLVSQIKELWLKATVIQKVIFIGIIVAVIVAFVFVFSFSSKPSTIPLFNVPITDQTAQDNIMYRLAQENVAATISTTGVISVEDEATARRMRSLLVREDLVPSNVDPWELFNTTSYTETDFTNNIKLQRSITNQITQHIEAIDEIDRAEIILTMPEKSLFRSEQIPVSASVLLYAKPGSSILQNKKQIQGIEKLLLRAIPGLTADNVTITDSSANQLNDWTGMEDIERVDIIAKQQKLIANLENQYRDRILSALKLIYGSDRVRDLNIKIDMDMSEKDVAATEYTPITIKADNPDTPYDDSELVKSITLSSETVTKKWTGTGVNPEGPAGVEGQNPPVYSDMSNLYGVSEETGVKANEVINTKQINETKSPSIDRVTVSVNIDGKWARKYENGNLVITPEGRIERVYTPIEPSELEEARALVQDAIGYNRSRGDSVTVQNIQFNRDDQFAREDAEFIRTENTKKTIFYVLTGIVVILLAFIIFRFISREMERRRRLKEEEFLRKQQMEREKILWESEQAGMEVTMSVEERKRAELQENAISMAKDHPEDVAKLIRTWLMEE